MLFEKVKALCIENKTNISEVERDCGLANATIRRWEFASPNVNSLTKVADHFGVSVDYLLGRGEHSLSDTAQEYARQFDELSEEKKQLAMAYMGVVKVQ